MVAQTEEGSFALADRCSHRGGPLSGGEVGPGCVTCPWHGSQFDLDTGVPKRGPASIPQPVYETRVVGDKLEVRRTERRALRQRAVRPK
jgi:nitrite reductase/ring-hydroxylating ferredoxin subunit